MPGGCSTCPGVVAVPVLTHTRGSETHGAEESAACWGLRCPGQCRVMSGLTAQHGSQPAQTARVPPAATWEPAGGEQPKQPVGSGISGRKVTFGIGNAAVLDIPACACTTRDVYDSSLKLVGVLRTVSGPARFGWCGAHGALAIHSPRQTGGGNEPHAGAGRSP